VLALGLLPLLLGLGYIHEGLTDPSPPVAGVRVLRRVRRRMWCRPDRATQVWPIAREFLRPVLAQAGMLTLLLGANRVAPRWRAGSARSKSCSVPGRITARPATGNA
jgi:hypothetical protein